MWSRIAGLNTRGAHPYIATLGAVAEGVVNQHQRQHRLSNRGGTNPHAGVVAAVGFHGDGVARFVDGMARLGNAGGGLNRYRDFDRLPCRNPTQNSARVVAGKAIRVQLVAMHGATLRNALEAGANHVLIKPVSPKQIAAILSAIPLPAEPAAANNGTPPADSALVRFWGVRGSIAAPGISTARVGGNTSCVEVIAGDKGEADLGLDRQTWQRLADTVDLIVDRRQMRTRLGSLLTLMTRQPALSV